MGRVVGMGMGLGVGMGREWGGNGVLYAIYYPFSYLTCVAMRPPRGSLATRRACMSDGLWHLQAPLGISGLMMMRAVQYGEAGSARTLLSFAR